MATYSIDVYDLTGGSVVSDIPALGPVVYSETLNSPGAAQITCAMGETGVTRDNLEPAQRAIRIKRDGTERWAGYLWSADPNFDDETVTFNCEGYGSRLRRWYPLDDLYFSGVDQFHIVRDLIDYVQLGVIPNGGMADYAYNFGWHVATTGDSGIQRHRHWCCPPADSIGDIIEELAAHDDGFDFAFLPDQSLHLWYPERGVQTATFEFSWSKQPNETSNVWGIGDVSIDGSDATTVVIGIPPQDCFDCEDITLVEPITGEDAWAKGPLMETLDMSHIDDEDARIHKAREYLRVYKHNRQQLTVRTPVLPWPANYNIGDWVHLTANTGYIAWTQRDVRVISWTVTVDGGTEVAEVMLDTQETDNP